MNVTNCVSLLRSADGEGGPGAGGGGRRLSHDGTRLHGHGRTGNLS